MIAKGVVGDPLRQRVVDRIRCCGQVALERAIEGHTTLEEALKFMPYTDVVHTRLHGLERHKTVAPPGTFQQAS